MNHYLLTIPRGHQCMHGYLVCNGERNVGGAIDRMMNWLDENDSDFRPLVPVILVTPLSRDIDTIRKIAGEQSEEIRRTISRATEHFSAWMMVNDDPDNKWLMKQH